MVPLPPPPSLNLSARNGSHSPEDTMKLTRLAGALAATALLVSGCSLTTHHTTTPATGTPAARTAAAPAHARTVATQARTILTHPALLPATGRAAYQHMLTDFITLAALLQPGAHYGT